MSDEIRVHHDEEPAIRMEAVSETHTIWHVAGDEMGEPTPRNFRDLGTAGQKMVVLSTFLPEAFEEEAMNIYGRICRLERMLARERLDDEDAIRELCMGNLDALPEVEAERRTNYHGSPPSFKIPDDVVRLTGDGPQEGEEILDLTVTVERDSDGAWCYSVHNPFKPNTYLATTGIPSLLRNLADLDEFATDGGSWMDVSEQWPKWICGRCQKVVSSRPRGRCHDCEGVFREATLDDLACDRCDEGRGMRLLDRTDYDRLCESCIRELGLRTSHHEEVHG